ncbi:MAG: integrase arm-type DNA-binding domain-containing protein [Desulfobulbus sp.]|nr:integrase arm-type DNA-binding domain-containing protein [Desulfobulbus sp.]
MLTETAIKNAKPKEKDYKLSDDKGLFLLVTRAGGKLWRLKYRFGKKEKLLGLGKYPEIPLKQARERRDEARKLLANGIDPSEARKEERAAEVQQRENTFGRVAEEWLEVWRANKAADTAKHVRYRLDNFILPFLADRPIASAGAVDVLETLRPIEAKALLDTAQRVKIHISQILQYAW